MLQYTIDFNHACHQLFDVLNGDSIVVRLNTITQQRPDPVPQLLLFQ